jgi:hypothetical protein
MLINEIVMQISVKTSRCIFNNPSMFIKRKIMFLRQIKKKSN